MGAGQGKFCTVDTEFLAFAAHAIKFLFFCAKSKKTLASAARLCYNLCCA
jgi:hypothetical protein